MGSSTLERELTDIVGAGHVLTDPATRAPFEQDWTGRFGAPSRCVVRPANTREVAAVLGACARGGCPVVAQGGNTGLVGGGVPRGGEVVLSLTRLVSLGAVDAASGQIAAGAGVTLGVLQREAAAAGMDAAVDFAARDSATVGGLVATNAGGMRAVRHGTVRARIAGLEAVLADGTIIDRSSGLLKDNAGYDLSSLLIGSEGTLGVITGVRWRLVPRLGARVAALLPLPSLAGATTLLAGIRPLLPSLEAADFFLDDGLSLVLEHLDLPAPIAQRAPVYVVLECAASRDPTDELAEALGAAGIEDAVVGEGTAERARLWRYREAHTEAIAAAGIPHKLDVGVPLARLAEFADAVPGVVRACSPGARVVLFGHLGDGNVHVNVLGASPDDERVDEAVLRLAAACGGTISAEHGVGIAKARWLGLARGEGELRAMRRIKDALDPAGLLNPGVILA
jgi:FAD/FMN-containing dehydrogenase